MARLLVLVDNLDRAQFFARWTDAFDRLGLEHEFLCYRRSVRRWLCRRGIDASIFRRRFGAKDDEFAEEERQRFDALCRGSLEVLRGDTSLDAARRVAPSFVRWIRDRGQRLSATHLFLWNGSQLFESLAKRAVENLCETRCFEIGNVPGKTFVDPDGVNAASSIATQPDRVRQMGVPTAIEFERWKTGYFDQKRNRRVPQASRAASLQWERIGDVLAAKWGIGSYPIRPAAMLARFVQKMRSKTGGARNAIHESLADREFYFYPFQVSTDTQLLVHSDVDNVAAVQMVYRQCVRDHVHLVIKPHPAEIDASILPGVRQALNTLRNGLIGGSWVPKVWIVSNPTEACVEHARHVFTINSTVGLEAMIANRPITVLGRSFYRRFSEHPQNLEAYLTRYLCDVEYFSEAEVPVDALHHVMQLGANGIERQTPMRRLAAAAAA